MKRKITIESVLRKGEDNATSRDTLKGYFNMSNRELYAQINRERLEGAPILSKKTDRGGYFLPECQADIDKYINLLKTGIKTQIRVLKALEDYSEFKEKEKDDLLYKRYCDYRNTFKDFYSLNEWGSLGLLSLFNQEMWENMPDNPTDGELSCLDVDYQTWIELDNRFTKQAPHIETQSL